MRRLLLALVVVPAVLTAGSNPHFDLLATFEAPRAPGEDGTVLVSFRALDPDLRLNETPAPRLRLELTETVLLDRQAPALRSAPAYDPLTAKYLDLAEPVRFPVAIAPTAPAGEQTVEAKVVFFYCSVRDSWCRRGTVTVDISVAVP
jgi:hypothetical protein